MEGPVLRGARPGEDVSAQQAERISGWAHQVSAVLGPRCAPL